MIDERGLLAAVRSAWRGGGYEVVGNGQELVLRGLGWLAVLPRGIVPRKVLALLVEHLGEIPEGAAWKVQKKVGAQTQMVDMPLGAVDSVRRELEEDPDPRRVNRTAMNWKGREIWQTEKLEVYAYDPEQVAMGAGGAMAFDGRLVWDDEGGLLVLDPEEGVIDEALRERLEQLPLA